MELTSATLTNCSVRDIEGFIKAISFLNDKKDLFTLYVCLFLIACVIQHG